MAAPDLTQRETVFVQKEGTDDPSYNTVGHPYSRLTIARALLDLADTSRYPAASSTFFHIIAVGPGTFIEAGITLPPWTFINGSCDGEGQPTTIIQLTADINLSSAWNANATARGGLANLTVRRSSGTPVIDFTMPVPTAGNPTRTIETFNLHHDLTSNTFEATSTNDNWVNELYRQFGTNTDVVKQTGGTSRFNNLWSAAAVTIVDKASFPAVGNWDGVVISSATSSVTANSTQLAGTTLRLSNSSVRTLVISETAPGTVAVSADTASLPIRSAVTYTGIATAANLTLLNDAAGVAYTPTTPGNWTPTVPTTVQQALDILGASAGGGGTGTFVRIIRTGNNNLAAWGTAGAAINDTANTFTDNSSAGAVAGVTAFRSFGIPTVSNATAVYATLANVYIDGAPLTAGGATATKTYAFYVNTGASFFGGQIQGPNGTAAAPTYSFANAADRGFYLDTGNAAIGVAIGGVQSLVLGGSGNIQTPGGLALTLISQLGAGGKIVLNTNGSVAITAQGSNQSITAAPSGTGLFVLNTSGNHDMIQINNGTQTLGIGQNANGAYIFQESALALIFGTNNAERARIAPNTGNLLIGGLTIDGTGVLQVPASITTAGGFGFGGSEFFMYRSGTNVLTLTASFRPTTVIVSGDGTSSAAAIGFLDNTGVGLSLSGAALLLLANGGTAMTMANTSSTGMRFNGYGAGALTTDASGNITATSDGRRKNVVGTFDRGLDAVLALKPKRYRWKKDSGMETEGIYAGFIAQDVLQAIPEAVSTGPDGFYTFSDRPVTAALVNSVQELAARVEKIEASLN